MQLFLYIYKYDEHSFNKYLGTYPLLCTMLGAEYALIEETWGRRWMKKQTLNKYMQTFK